MRYAVCVIETGAGMGDGVGREVYASSKRIRAKRYAERKAMGYYYGLVIVDRATGRLDWGEGWEDPSGPA